MAERTVTSIVHFDRCISTHTPPCMHINSCVTFSGLRMLGLITPPICTPRCLVLHTAVQTSEMHIPHPTLFLFSRTVLTLIPLISRSWRVQLVWLESGKWVNKGCTCLGPNPSFFFCQTSPTKTSHLAMNKGVVEEYFVWIITLHLTSKPSGSVLPLWTLVVPKKQFFTSQNK